MRAAAGAASAAPGTIARLKRRGDIAEFPRRGRPRWRRMVNSALTFGWLPLSYRNWPVVGKGIG